MFPFASKLRRYTRPSFNVRDSAVRCCVESLESRRMLSVAPEDVTAAWRTDGKISVAWEAGSDAAQTYQVEVKNTDLGENFHLVGSVAGTTFTSIIEVPGGTERFDDTYDVRVRGLANGLDGYGSDILDPVNATLAAPNVTASIDKWGNTNLSFGSTPSGVPFSVQMSSNGSQWIGLQYISWVASGAQHFLGCPMPADVKLRWRWNDYSNNRSSPWSSPTTISDARTSQLSPVNLTVDTQNWEIPWSYPMPASGAGSAIQMAWDERGNIVFDTAYNSPRETVDNSTFIPGGGSQLGMYISHQIGTGQDATTAASVMTFVDLPDAATTPAAPGSLTATVVGHVESGGDKIALMWNNVPDNETGFRLERKRHDQPDTAWAQVGGNLGADVTHAEDVLPDPGQAWDYRLCSVGATTNSTWVTTGPVTGLVLQSVDFHGLGFRAITDDTGTVYGTAEWYDGNKNGQIDGPATNPFLDGTVNLANESRFPIAYARSTPATSSVVTLDIGLPFAAVPAGTQVRGQSDSMYFGSKPLTRGPGSILATASGFSAKQSYAANAPAAPLGQLIDSTILTIDWEFSIDAGVTWASLGSTDNHLYVTGGAGGASYHTVIYLGSEGAKGKRPHQTGDTPTSAEDADADGVLDAGEDTNGNGVLDAYYSEDRDVADGVWGKFFGNSTKRVDGVKMSYSHETDVISGEPAFALVAAGQDLFGKPGMLARDDGRGQCTAWADLLVITLGVQGVASTSTRIDPPGVGNRFAVRSMPAQGSEGADYLTGTLGEGGFSFHQVVRIGAYPDRIYDPSYGGLTIRTDERSVELKYEDVNITHLRIGGVWYSDPVGGPPLLVFTP